MTVVLSPSMEYLLKESIIYAQLERLSRRIDRVERDVHDHRIGYRLTRYRRRLLEREHADITKQAREWGVI